MAQINIVTTPEEQQIMLETLSNLPPNKVISVAAIASKAHINPNRARYILTDLIEAGKVKRHVAKAFNEHFIRYSYEVIKDIK